MPRNENREVRTESRVPTPGTRWVRVPGEPRTQNEVQTITISIWVWQVAIVAVETDSCCRNRKFPCEGTMGTCDSLYQERKHLRWCFELHRSSCASAVRWH